MTRAKWAEMSSEERNVKVAELAYWSQVIESDGSRMWVHRSFPNHPYPNRVFELPKYLEDLNAMQVAIDFVITVHNDSLVQSYIFNLLRVCGEVADGTYLSKEFNWYDCEVCAHATAEQRAEAFVLTLEK